MPNFIKINSVQYLHECECFLFPNRNFIKIHIFNEQTKKNLKINLSLILKKNYLINLSLKAKRERENKTRVGGFILFFYSPRTDNAPTINAIVNLVAT